VRVSASKAGLLPLCQYPFRESTPWDNTPPGRAAEYGQRFHDAIAGVVDPAVKPLAIKGTEWLLKRLKHATAWLDAQTFHSMPEAEVAFAYDWNTDTSRVVGKNIGRRYKQHGKTDDEIAGSADFVVVLPGLVVVYDWKTGRAVTDSVWPQMEMLGVMAARAYGVERVELRPLHVTDYGIEDGMRRELGAEDLRRVADGIRRNVGAIADAWPEPGDHCDGEYCPARDACGLYQANRKAG
jgi:hypothetical protein